MAQGKLRIRDFDYTLSKPKERNIQKNSLFFPLHISEKGVKSGDFYQLFPSKKSFCFIAINKNSLPLQIIYCSITSGHLY